MPHLLLIELFLQILHVFMQNLNLPFYVMKTLLHLCDMWLFLVLWWYNCLLLSLFGFFLQHLWTDVDDYWRRRRAFPMALIWCYWNRSFLIRLFGTLCLWPYVVLFLVIFLLFLFYQLLLMIFDIFLLILWWLPESNRLMRFLCSIYQIEQNLVFLFKLFSFFLLYF